MLACFVLKENRNLRALVVIIPIIAIAAIWGMLSQLTGSGANTFTQLVSTLMIAAAILWLLSERISSYKPAGMFIISLVLLAAIGFLSMFSFGGLNFGQENLWILIFQFIWAVALLFGILITRYFCRKSISGVSFSFWLLLWMTVVSNVMMFITMMVTFAFVGQFNAKYLIFLIVVPVYGIIFAILAYLLILPYLILTFKSNFYKKRLLACLRLAEFVKKEEFSQTDISENTNF